MSKHEGGLTLLLVMMMSMMLVSGCVRVSPNAICDGTERYRDIHADALLVPDVPGNVVISGASLIAAIDAACD